MDAQSVVTLAVALSTLVGAFVVGIRFLVKHFLYELRPNGGSSMKDSMDRLESRVDELYVLLAAKSKNE